MQTTFSHGRLGGTGYLSILPVDQGIEHSAGASFAPNPDYFDPENIVKLAIEGGCNAVTSTLGVLGAVSRKYAHQIPFVLKINHNELLTYPNVADQKLFAGVKQAFDMGAVGVGATIYFGSPESGRQIEEISRSFAIAHELGMYTILWCYIRNPAFKTKEKDYHLSADLTGQANHLGTTIQADIIKQKLPENNGGYTALKMAGSDYGKDRSSDLFGADFGSSDRSVPISGVELLCRSRGSDQFGWCFREERHCGSGEDGRDQQASGGYGFDFRSQSVSKAAEGWGGDFKRRFRMFT